MILFHGTTLKAVLAIIENKKLIPQGSLGSNSLHLAGNPVYKPEHYLGYLFFTDELWRAVDYCTIAMSNSGDYTTGNIMVILECDIPEELLSPDYCDMPERFITWSDSLDSVHQVSVKGTIPTSCIKRVLFVDYDNPEVIVRTATSETLPSVLNEFQFITM